MAVASSIRTQNTIVINVNMYGISPEQLTATIRTPSYPPSDRSADDIAWLIHTAPGYKLHVEVHDVGIEVGCAELVIADASVRGTPRVLSRLSGGVWGRSYNYSSVGSGLLMRYKSECVVRGRGFSGIVRVVGGSRQRITVVIVVGNVEGGDDDAAKGVEVEVFLPDAIKNVICSMAGSENSGRSDVVVSHRRFAAAAGQFFFDFLFGDDDVMFWCETHVHPE